MTEPLLKLERVQTPTGEALAVASTWNAAQTAIFSAAELAELCRRLPELFPEHFETSATKETAL